MATQEFYLDSQNAHPFVKPWTVVTKGGVIADRFDSSQSQAAHDCAQRLASGGDPTVRLYEVDSQVIPSPTTGDHIDCEINGWIRIA